jgi:hypothetical protein
VAEDGSKEIGGKPSGDYDRHKKLVHFGYSFGGFILTAIVDYLFLWPENHLTALLAMAAWLSVTAIVELTVWDFSPWVTAGAVIGLFGVAVVANFIIGPIQVAPVVGWLQPANEPTPPTLCDRAPTELREAESPVIIIGNVGFIPSDPMSYDAVQIGQCAGLNIHQTANGIAISTDIYSREGQLIGRLRDNGYSVVGDRKLVVERSGDLSAMIVHDDRGPNCSMFGLLIPKLFAYEAFLPAQFRDC